MKSETMAGSMWTSLRGRSDFAEHVEWKGSGRLASAFPVTDFAAASVATAGLGVVEVLEAMGTRSKLTVDQSLSSAWFGSTVEPIGWQIPAPWDSIAGDYQAQDGWIRLHTNARAHRAAAERVLGLHSNKTGVAAEVARWRKADLQEEIVRQGGCAAEMLTANEWAEHPQGRSVFREPLVAWRACEKTNLNLGQASPERPLAGLRVLDLTRVLAGPVATRFLAGLGAQVLRVDPPNWDEPGVLPEVMLGKRSCRLDLRAPADRTSFERLLSQADVIVHGYRPGALEGLGYGEDMCRQIRPGLIDVALDAWGWTGPWAGRRGFDSLVQMSTGIAHAGALWKSADKPVPLPVQALDQGTGYLIAAAALRAIAIAMTQGHATTARLSLARTAVELLGHAGQATAESELELLDALWLPEQTSWGAARRLAPPLSVSGTTIRWDRGAVRLGGDAPVWPAAR